MKKVIYISVFIVLAFSCKENAEKAATATQADQNTEKTQRKNNNDTSKMVAALDKLVANGAPTDYYHWNSKLAQFYKSKLSEGNQQQRLNTWLQYCTELLASGNSQECINQITAFLKQINQPYAEILSPQNKQLFELLALAYLRLGEQKNCQFNHTAASCIIPLKEAGFHKSKEGSQEAIKIYRLLQDRFPDENYKWLLNVAYMTLGEYPKNVPAKYKITVPSKNELANFPAFNEIAMNVGAAVDGLSGGTCVDDFNNDGFLDIFATSYGMEDNVKLLLSNTQGGFVDHTENAGLSGIVSGLNSIHADYDNDGFKDIFILRGAWLGDKGAHPNSLLKNMGDGTFQDVTFSSNIISYHPTQTASWGDFNNDGFLDLFIGNEGAQANGSHPCELFKNNGDGTFTEVAMKQGLGNISAFIKGVTWGDINNDGWQDLYISVLGGNNYLFKNENGKFTNISETAGIQEPFYSFPCWFWDVNNDGLQDIFVSGYDTRNLKNIAGDYAKELQNIQTDSEKPRLYINNGDETFTESAKAYGISKPMYAMGANFGDLENDGYLDFYLGTGAPDFTSIVPNRMFKNMDGKSFKEVTSAGNFGHIQKGHGVAFADLDNDGDQDIYAVMGGAFEGDTFTNVLFENPITKNNWIVLELQGTTTNTSAIGTRISLKLNNGKTYHRVVSTGGTFGSSSLQQEIGLGSASEIDEIIIHWPGQEPQRINSVAVNQKLKITEGYDTPEKMSYTAVPFTHNATHAH